MAEPVALAALALDAAIGWPGALYRRIGHPVGIFARLIGACEARWNRPTHSPPVRRALGVITVLLLVVGTGAAGWAIERILDAALGVWSWPVIAVLAWPALAQRSLHAHVAAVAAPLAGGDLAAARTAVGNIVGRDTGSLDEAGVARAAIESLSESFCDGVVAPLFWLLLLGLPGVWICKAINTADSLIGHREPRWRDFGWAAARSDDLLNLIPARLSGLLVCIAGAGGWRIMWRDARRHASPNAGWPEAAMAGALKLRLAGPATYDGVAHLKPWIGDSRQRATADDIIRALRLYNRACLLLWIVAGSVAWLA
ncbi:adenosylcobinamide-phosphate synthase CbiB [Sphingomonas sp. RS6]